MVILCLGFLIIAIKIADCPKGWSKLQSPWTGHVITKSSQNEIDIESKETKVKREPGNEIRRLPKSNVNVYPGLGTCN